MIWMLSMTGWKEEKEDSRMADILNVLEFCMDHLVEIAILIFEFILGWGLSSFPDCMDSGCI